MNASPGMGLRWVLLSCVVGTVATFAVEKPAAADVDHKELKRDRPQAEGRLGAPSGELIVFLRPGTDAQRFAKDHDLEWKRTFRSDASVHVFQAKTPEAAQALVEKLKMPQRGPGAAKGAGPNLPADQRVRGCYLNRRTLNVKHFTPNDPYYGTYAGYPGQWHLGYVKAPEAWAREATGAGVTIGIEDDSLEGTHPDLAPNFRADDSWDFGQDDPDPAPYYWDDQHGVSTSGVAAARGGNGIGVTGAAPFAGLAGLRVDFVNGDDAMFADAMMYHSSGRHTDIAIGNHSYGISAPFISSGAEVQALSESVAAGTIHCFSAGNERNTSGEDSNKKDLQHSPDAISVAALGHDYTYSSYSCFGACVFVTTPSNGVSGYGITTTDRTRENQGYNGSGDGFPDGDYTSRFGGTSSASPLAAGVLALVKQVQPNLNTRFAKHLLVKTCNHTVLPGSGTPVNNDYQGWMVNGAGNYFNQSYGFGLIDADKLTQEAVKYTGVTPLVVQDTWSVSVGATITDNSPTGVSRTFNIPYAVPLEEILVTLDISHTYRGDLVAYLISPSGKTSRLFTTAADSGDNITWTFCTNAFWGENPQGTWTLRVADLTAGTTGTWNSFSVQARCGQLIQDTQAPAVAQVSSPVANGTYGTGAVIPITVRFSEPVVVTGTPQLTLETGTTDAVVSYVSGSGTDTLLFSYVVAASHSTPDLDYLNSAALALNGGTIKDRAGNAALLTLPVPGTAGSLGYNKDIAINVGNTWIWNAGTAGWNAAGNWLPTTVPVSSDRTCLIFPTTAGPYTAANDLPGVLNLQTLRLDSSAAGRTVTGNPLRFTSTGASILQDNAGAFSIANPIEIVTALNMSGAGSGTVSLTGVVSGTGGLVKSGSYTAILSTTLPSINSYQGVTKVAEGVLAVGSPDALGAASAGTDVTAGGTLGFQNSIAYGALESVSLAGNGSANRGALCNLAGTNSFAGPITLKSNASLGADAGTLTLSGPVSGAFGLTKVGTGAIQLASSCSYTGATKIDAGTLGLQTAGDLPASSEVTVATGAILDLNNNAKRIGSLAGSGDVNLGSGLLTVGENNRSTDFTGVLSGTDGGLTKTGRGTLWLSGASTYTGPTVVEAGVLQADTLAASGSSTGTGSVTVRRGATLSGKGKVTGSVTVENGGTLAPHDAAHDTVRYATLTTGALSLSDESKWVVGFGGATQCDQIAVQGNVTLDGLLYVRNFGLSAGTYTILTYPSGSTLTNNTLLVADLPAGWTASVGVSGTSVQVTFSSANVDTWVGSGNADAPGSGAWSNKNSWLAKTVPTSNSGTRLLFGGPNQTAAYAATDDLTGIFDLNQLQLTTDYWGTSTSVTTIAPVAAQSLRFQTSNALVPFIRQGASGRVYITLPIEITSKLRFDGSGDGWAYLRNPISGSGSLHVDSSGGAMINLTGNNTFTGGLTLTAGLLGLGHDSAAGTGPLTLEGGLVFADLASRSLANNIVLDGSIVLGLGWASLSNTLTFTGTTTLRGPVILSARGIPTTTFSNTISGASQCSLTKTGGNTVVLSGTNTYSGKTIIAAGTLGITTGDSNLGVAPSSLVADHLILNGGTLRTAATMALNANRGVWLGLDGGTIQPTTGTLTLNAPLSGPGSLTKNGAATLAAHGTVGEDLHLTEGTLIPGVGTAFLQVKGSYRQSPSTTTTLGVVLRGSGNCDHLDIAGTAHLAGTLSVSLNAGYTPAVGDSFTVLNYGNRNGSTFQSLTLPALTSGRYWTVRYDPHALVLEVKSGVLSIGSVDVVEPANRDAVPQYEKVELLVNLANVAAQTKFYEWDPARDGLNLQADFDGPASGTGDTVTVNGFYDGANWRVRFAPTALGAWTMTVRATDRNGTATPFSAGTFTCVPSSHPGFLKINGNYLQFSDGRPFFGVGHNNGWQYDLEKPSFAEMAANGENLLNFWNAAAWAQPSWASESEPWWAQRAPIENVEQGIGNYNQDACGYLDGLVQRAEQANVYLLPSLWSHGELRGAGHSWGQGYWDNNAYSSVCTAAQFLDSSNTEQWRLQKNFFRYLLARWGHSRAVAGWIAVVELNGTSSWESSSAMCTTWCQNVATEFNTGDKYRRNGVGLVPSTAWIYAWSTSDEAYDPGMPLRSVDTYRYDGRTANDNVTVTEAIALQTATMCGTGKPSFHGEFGAHLGKTGASQPTHFHNGIWASLASKAAVTANLWCDEGPFPSLANSTYGASLRTHARILADFVADITYFGNANLTTFQPVNNTTNRGWGLRLADRGFAWLQHHGSTGSLSGQALTISGLDNGSYEIRWYDVWNSGSTPYTTTTQNVSTGTLSVSVPTGSPTSDLALKFKRTGFTRNTTWTGATSRVWNTDTNWLGGAAPRSGDTIRFDSNSASNLNTQDTLFSLEELALSVANPTANVSIEGNAFSLGSAGIDLSAASRDLEVKSSVLFNGSQVWNVLTSRILTVSGLASGKGTLSKQGAGRLVLKGANTYSGNTTVGAGTLLADSVAGSATGTGHVTINGGATLGGNGTAGSTSATVTVNGNGTVSPGASVGTLTLNGTQNFLATSQLYIEITNSSTDRAADLLRVNGSVNITSGAILLVDLSGYTYNENAQFTVLEYTGNLSGSFTLSVVGNTFNKSVYVQYFPDTKIVKIGIGMQPTPVTWTSLAARNQSGGVVVEWTCASELENAGFNVYRRSPLPAPRSAASSPWTKLNPTLVPGRLTYAAPTAYRWFDIGGNADCEYCVESVSLDNEAERCPGVARPCGFALGLQPDYLNTLFDQVYTDYRTQKGQVLTVKAILAQIGGALDRSVPSVVAVRGAPAPVTVAPALIGPVVPAAFRSAKVQTRGKGVVWVPRASLPEDLNPQRLSLYYEGQVAKVLDATADGVALWARGYEDDYTDVDAFFLVPSLLPTGTLKQGTAKNLFKKNVRAETVQNGIAEQDFHDVFYSWNSNLMPYDYPPWFSANLLTEGSSCACTLNTRKLLPGAGRLTVRLWSRSASPDLNPDHGLIVSVNGTPVGCQTWDGGGMMLELTFAVPAGALKEGANAIELTTPNLGGAQLSLLHALRLEYPQTLVGDGPLTVRTNGTGSGVVEVSGLTVPTAWVVDESSNAVQLTAYEAQQTAGGYAIRWKYPLRRMAQYYVVPAGCERAPLSVTSRTVAPLTTPAAYLAVGQAALGAAVQPLLDARAAEGLDGLFADQERLFDAYGYGRFGPQGIQRAVRSVRPRYLLLLGRSTYDTKNWLGLKTETGCPTVLTSTRLYAQTSADGEYGVWAGGAHVAVGRLPIDEPEGIANAVAKILAYRGSPLSSGSGVMMAGVPDPQAGDFHAEADQLMDSVELTWTRTYQTEATTAGRTTVRNAFLKAVNEGAEVAVFVGHGSSGSWSSGAMATAYTPGWTGNTVVLVASCTGAYFLRHPQYPSVTLAEALLKQPGGGTPAFIGSSTYTASGPHAQFMGEVLKRTQSREGMRWGDALREACNWSAGQTEALSDLGRTEQLLGDPALPVTANDPEPAPAKKKPAPPPHAPDKF